ncbi:transposase [Streptomyces hirsutus]|uniref:transposase n=1 Tax=Streptomyces hirsutus TaxID=35620 RepID=UPI0036AB909B
MGVFLGYAPSRGRALIGRELHLPDESWVRDAARRKDAAVPKEAGSACKPELGRRMPARAPAAGAPFTWVASDAVYISFVRAVAATRPPAVSLPGLS